MARLTVQEALQAALQHHQDGRLQQAEALYRQVLAEQPNQIDALHLLGVIADQAGRHDTAVELIGRALDLRPGYAEACLDLGNALRNTGRLEAAVAAYRRAIALNPRYPEAYGNLGNVLAEAGQLNEAIAAYRHAIALNPGDAETHGNLGSALRDRGQLDEAIATYSRAVALAPGSPNAHFNLANALRGKGRLDEAIAAYQQAIALKTNYPEAHNNLSLALRDKGQFHAAETACRQAIALKSGYPQAHNNLGVVLRDQGRLDEAIVAYRQAIALQPDFPEAHVNLGNALRDHGQLDEAIAAFRQAVAIRSEYPEAYNNLGNTLKDMGQLDEAIAAFRQAIDLNPNLFEAHGNLVYTMHFHPGYDAAAIAHEHRCWNRQHAQPLQQCFRPHANDRDPDRRLRIGYVSPYFYDHVVGRNLLPLFRQHDRSQFHITCYAHVAGPDAITGQFQQHADVWRNIVGMADEQVAQFIRQDQIDILVDLALHMAHSRLLVFARKPAPVQATFAGYPASTGLSAIDYRLSDPYLDPADIEPSLYSEQTVRLPNSFWCYDPLDSREILVNPLPALEKAYVTFGCLNNFCKINEQVLALWAQVLRQVEGSRLLLLSEQGAHRQRTLDCLNGQGVQPDRIEFVAHRPRLKYMELYHRIDVGLDSFPYNGHTTSLDSFWMGVPVVTLVGQTPVSRAGWCQLSNLGMPELAGQSPAQFVEIAVALARDLPRLAELRRTLRERMEQSPLMDAAGFARGIEAAYRQMWRRWCADAASLR